MSPTWGMKGWISLDRSHLDSGIVPKMDRFPGSEQKGYAFLQSFRTMNGSFTDKRKKQIFAVCWKEKLYTGI